MTSLANIGGRIIKAAMAIIGALITLMLLHMPLVLLLEDASFRIYDSKEQIVSRMGILLIMAAVNGVIGIMVASLSNGKRIFMKSMLAALAVWTLLSFPISVFIARGGFGPGRKWVSILLEWPYSMLMLMISCGIAAVIMRGTRPNNQPSSCATK